MDETSPTYQSHREWVDSLVQTPSPQARVQRAWLTSPTPQSGHVLRGSKSFAARSFRSRPVANSLTFPDASEKSNNENEPAQTSMEDSAKSVEATFKPCLATAPLLRETAYRAGPWRLRRSPTPSLRKKRAEAIVKAHGSPQHVRVTAGGRIVPSEQSPLCHPRYGYSAIKANGGLIKFAPNHSVGKVQWTFTTGATQNGCLAQDPDGRLCQIIDGHIMPLLEVDGALRLHMPAPNLKVAASGSIGQHNEPSLLSNKLSAPTKTSGSLYEMVQTIPAPVPTLQNIPPDPSVAQQLNALELEYSKYEHELRELDKTEVIHAPSMSKVAKEALVAKRRELVISMDKVRKAIKNLKSLPPQTPPTVPGSVHASDPYTMHNGLHYFAPATGSGTIAPVNTLAQDPMYGQLAQDDRVNPSVPVSGNYAFDPIMVPPGMFVLPPPLDGSMALRFMPSAFPVDPSAYVPPQAHYPATEPTSTSTTMPQIGGSPLITDAQNNQTVTSPRESHALPIKAPEPSGFSNTRTKLNPMSPEYTPSGRKAETVKQDTVSLDDYDYGCNSRVALSPLPKKEMNFRIRDQDSSGIMSPSKTTKQLPTSTVSSYNTADFFPNDRAMLSTQHRMWTGSSYDKTEKENIGPEGFHIGRLEGKGKGKEKDAEGPPPGPPGTPVDQGSALSIQEPFVNVHADGMIDTAYAREQHNVSPKDKRKEWLFMDESAAHISQHSSSSPASDRNWSGISYKTDGPAELAGKSRDWYEGFEAGIRRLPIHPKRAGQYLEGYIHGLHRSQPGSSDPKLADHAILPHSSPTIMGLGYPELVPPISRSASRLQIDRRQPLTIINTAIETPFQSSDTLKQAMMAPQNEHAVLSPSEDGPGLAQLAAFHHNRNESMAGGSSTTDQLLRPLQINPSCGFPIRQPDPCKTDGQFPEAGAGQQLMEKQTRVPGSESKSSAHVHAVSKASVDGDRHLKVMPVQPRSPSVISNAALKSGDVAEGQVRLGNRVNSIGSANSNAYRPFPGTRFFSPHLEWKSPTSIAQSAGFAAGSFAAHPQFDGTSEQRATSAGIAQVRASLTPWLTTGVIQQGGQDNEKDRIASPASQSRFKEGSLDGMSSPPNSPPMSPRSAATGSKAGSPSKSASPAKHKFEQIAGKVGIKVTNIEKERPEESDHMSPQGKRRWRDLWKNARKDGNKDEVI